MSSIDLESLPGFADPAALIRWHAQRAPSRPAVVLGERVLDYAGLDALMDRVAGPLQRDGLQPGDVIALCAATSIEYAAVFLGALRAGIAVAPLEGERQFDGVASRARDVAHNQAVAPQEPIAE